MRRFYKTEKGKRIIWEKGSIEKMLLLGRNELTFVGQSDKNYKLKTGLYLKEEKPDAHVNLLNATPLEFQISSNWILHD